MTMTNPLQNGTVESTAAPSPFLHPGDPHVPAAVTRPERMAALRRTALMDSSAEELFDRMTRLAAKITGAPISLVSLVDETRQFFKSAVGLPEPWASMRQTPLTHSFCKHVVGSGEPLLIENSRVHPLVRGNGATHDIGIVSYAGIPLTTSDGETLGSFCVIDTAPRLWSNDEVAVLRDLADTLSMKIELRTATVEAREQAERAERERLQKTQILERVTDAFFALDTEWRFTYVNRRAERFLGHTSEELLHRSIWEAFPEAEGLAFAQQARGAVIAGRALQFEERWAANGRWFEVHVYPAAEGVTVYMQDVSARKRLESEVREREEQLRQFAENIDGIFWMTDPKHTEVLYVNQAYERIWGRSRESLLDDVRTYLDPVHPEDRDAVIAAMAAASECAADVRYRVLREDGTLRWVHDRAFPVRDETGQVTRIVGFVDDITEQRSAEDRLASSEERYRLMVEGSREVFFYTHDLEGRFQYLSPSVQAVLGFSAEELIGQRYQVLHADPAENHFADQMTRAALERGERTSVYYVVLRRRDGREITVEVSETAVVRDGVVVGIQGFARDVTQRVRAQEALAARERQLSEAQRLARMGSWSWDIAADAVAWSDELYRLYGLDAYELTPTYQGYLERVHPDDRAVVEQAIRGGYETGSFEYRCRFVRPDGQVRWQISRGALVRGPDGTPLRMVGTAQDVTEQFEAERTLMDAERRFHTVVESLGEALLITDLQDRVQYANPRVEQIFGYSPEELHGKRAADVLLAAEDRAAFHARQAQRAEGAAERYVFPHRHRSGRRIWCEVTGSPYRDADGTVVGTVGVVADVTQRVEAEAEAERQRAFAEQIMSTMGEGLTVTDSNARFEYVNPAYAAMMGMNPEELIGRSPFEVTVAEDRPVLQEARARRQRGERTSYEKRLLHVDGSHVPVMVTSAPRYVGGENVGSISVITNLGRLKQIEESLRCANEQLEARVQERTEELRSALEQSGRTLDELTETQASLVVHNEELAAARQRYQHLFELAPMAYLTTDTHGVICEANAAAGILLGVPTHWLIGKPLKMYESRDRGDLAHTMAEVESSSRCDEVDLVLQPRDRAPVEVSCTVVRSSDEGDAATLRWALRDVTRQREMERQLVRLHSEKTARAEADLRSVEHRYRLLIESVEDYAFVLLDTEGCIAGWNRGAERINGYGEREALGRSFAIFHTPEARAQGEPERLLAHANAQGTARWEGQFVRNGGQPYFAEVGVTALRDQAGVTTGYAVIVRDRSEWKKTQDALREVETNVRHMQKMDAIGRLAGTIVHDFNNVLTVVKGQAEIGMMELDAGHPAWSDLKEIIRAADRGVALNQQLLAFSRETPLQASEIEPNGVLGDMRRMMERVLGEQVKLEMQLDAESGSVRIDRTQLEQILMNVAANARDAMPGGGTFTVRTRRVQLGADLARRQAGMEPGPYLLLTLTDTGRGMDAETQAQCFEPFFTTKAQGKGAGMGLSTVYGVLRQNGGHVRLESHPGRGTTVRIYLPAVQSAAPASAAPLPLRQRTVLLVEDEDSVRKVIRRVLERDGYAVLEAADAGSAIRIAEAHAASIDAVVADRVVPGADPATLLAALEDRLPGVGIIRISGYSDPDGSAGAAAEHTGILLSKPFAPSELSAAMRTLLGAPPRSKAVANI